MEPAPHPEEKTPNTEIETKGPAIKHGWLRGTLFVPVSFIIYAIFTTIGTVFVVALSGMDMNQVIGDPGSIMDRLGPMNMLVITLFGLLGQLLIIWIFRRFLDRKSMMSLGFNLRGYGNDLLYGSVIGIALISAGFIVLLIIGNLTIVEYRLDTFSMFAYLLLFIFAGINEEIMVRGYILTNFSESMNKYVALALSSIVFAALHLSNANLSAVAILNLFLAGILLGIYYIHKRNLWFSIGMHFTWNFFQGPVFGFEVSGNKTGALIVQDMAGNDLITGGAFGFEGSLIATAGIIFLIVLLDRQYSKKEKTQTQVIT